MYHNKVNLSLTHVQRFGSQAHNYEMDYVNFAYVRSSLASAYVEFTIISPKVTE